MYFQCVSNRAVCRPRVPFYEYFKPRPTQIVLSATRRKSDLTSRIRYFEAPSPRSVAFHARVFLPTVVVEHAVTYRLHHLSRFVIFHPLSTESSPRSARPRCLSLSLLSFLHTCAHIFIVSFSPFRIDALSPRMSPPLERAVCRSVVQKRGGTIYSVICGFTHCCRNRAV